VAVSLVSDVVAFIAGSDLTMAERLVLLIIAERANASTREAWQSTADGKRWVLAEIVGLSEDGLKSVLQRLGKRDLEVRVPIGKDKKDKIMYAVKGRQTTYRLPFLPGVSTPPNDLYGGDTTPQGGVYTPDGGDTTPPFSSASRQASRQASSEPRQIVLKNTDAKPSEADAVVARIVNERNPDRPSGFIAYLAKTGELQDWVNQVRAARIKIDRDQADVADRKMRQSLPRCHHGMAGGELPHSETRAIRCKQCRDIQRLNERKSA
jgi:hypothetical protein